MQEAQEASGIVDSPKRAAHLVGKHRQKLIVQPAFTGDPPDARPRLA
jgi:hypothetical protein